MIWGVTYPHLNGQKLPGLLLSCALISFAHGLLPPWSGAKSWIAAKQGRSLEAM